MHINDIMSKLRSSYPGRDWDQRCQQLVWNVIDIVHGSVPHTYPTAAAARNASRIESTDPNKAPVGAIHYWRNPAEGHVGVSLGGSKVLMTGTASALNGGQMVGNNFGITTVQAYSAARGNPYVGWSRTNGANPSLIGKIQVDAGKQIGGGTGATKAQWRTIQDWLKRLGRYSGPVDGVPGRNTWKGIQITVRDRAGYTGPIDGVPGANTYKAMQRYAANGGGYRGPIDGVLGPNSWAGFVKRLAS